jgi:DNA-binding transcriptional MerR regulator
MKLAELAARTGTPAATIKFYLREGLLPAGRAVNATLADYGDPHVRRLGTIRVLRKGLGLSVATVRAIVDLIDGGEDRIEVMKALRSVVLGHGSPQPGRTEAGTRIVQERGWPDLPTGARAALDDHLEAMERLGVPVAENVLSAYAEAADLIAAADVADVDGAGDLEDLVSRAAVGMHMNRQLMLRLVALAQASRSILHYGPTMSGPSRLSPPEPGHTSTPHQDMPQRRPHHGMS